MKSNLSFVKKISETVTLENFKKAIEKKDVKAIRRIVKFVDEQDLATWISEFSPSDQIFFLRSLDRTTASEVFNHFDQETVLEIINRITNTEMKDLLSPLFADDIVELIEEAPPSLVYQILNSISAEKRRHVNYILGYPENSIGFEMQVDFLKILISEKVKTVFEKVKKEQDKKKIEKETKYYYVVDSRNILVGFFSLEDLISADPEAKIFSVMKTDIVYIRALDQREKGIRKARKYQISELPVVDNGLRLIGILNADTILEISEEELEENISKAAGVSETSTKKGYFETGVKTHFLSRIFWLIITFFISTISNIILILVIGKESFTETKKWLFFIIPYLPFLLAMVGNIALQGTAIMIKYISTEEIRRGKYRSVFIKEAKILSLTLISISIGIFIRKIIFDVVYYEKNLSEFIYWKENFIVMFVVFFSVTLAYVFSIGLPILADRFGRDPALMSSPLLTTMIDLSVTGFSFLITYGFFKVLAL